MYLVFINSVFATFVTGIATSNDNFSTFPEIKRLQDYIQIDTTVDENFSLVTEFWAKLARISEVNLSVHEFVKNYPIIVLKWPGTNSSSTSIILNTNIDVIPTDIEDGWTYPPFSAHIDQNGDMYGRGTQEYKSVTIQHYEALCRLRTKNVTLLRDLYLVLTPDRETGSNNGIVQFLESEEFKAMNAGFFLVGGISTEGNDIAVIYRGKARWYFRIKCSGPSGDSTKFFNSFSSSDGSCGRFYVAYAKFRDEQYRLLQCGSDVANLTVINFVGPKVHRVMGAIPNTIYLYFDAYLGVKSNLSCFKTKVNQWVRDSGNNIELQSLLTQEVTGEDLIGNGNPYWMALQEASRKLNIPFNARTSPGPEEASHIVKAGYPVFGISPLPNTEDLVHAVDERINLNTFLNGITIFEEIFKNIGNIPADQTSDDPSVYLAPYL